MYTMGKLKVSAINNLKRMAGGHTVHERQAILSTAVVVLHPFCMENENHMILSCKSAIRLPSSKY